MAGRKISWLALLIALSVVGSMLKIPAVVGSIALDAFPALIAASLFGGGLGAVVAGIGHLVSALVGGLPLGPFHILIALEMSLLVWIYGRLYQQGKKVLAGSLFVLGNTFAAPLPFIFFISKAFYMGIVPSLLVGSLLNIGLALLLAPRLMTVSRQFQQGEARK
ncbi:ECF transporter S component [Cytobacillus sp. FJAT-54145]|uniref:ECF transporter S component n=1 Tax=Cytobacillus spartinae TaxID=3299023 RepID=A0ABW6KJG0_9BACI